MRKMPKDHPICWPSVGLLLITIFVGFFGNQLPDTEMHWKTTIAICVYIFAGTSFIIGAIHYLAWVVYNKLCDIENKLGRKKKELNPNVWDQFAKTAKELHDEYEENEKD